MLGRLPSPFIQMVVSPALGRLSDSCGSRLGRRRPFILIAAFGSVLAMLLVPFAHAIGACPAIPLPLVVHTYTHALVGCMASLQVAGLVILRRRARPTESPLHCSSSAFLWRTCPTASTRCVIVHEDRRPCACTKPHVQLIRGRVCVRNRSSNG